MIVKPNDRLIWHGQDGILKHGQLYLVWQTRDTNSEQEFTVKHKDWQMIEPIIWWKVGEPFIFLREDVA